MAPETRATLNGIGRYWPAILATVVVTLMAWAGKELLEMKNAITELQTIVELTTNNRYRAGDAAKDFEARDRLLRGHEERIRALERR